MHLNIIQLAESLGVEESVVLGWVGKEGLPAIEDRGRLVFDRAQVLQWAAERGLIAKAGFLAPGSDVAGLGPRLNGFLKNGGIWRHVAPDQVVPLLERIVQAFPASPPVRQILLERLRASAGITWAPVGNGFALPHLRAHVALGRDLGLIALLLLNKPLTLPEPVPDDVPVTRLAFFVAPSPRAHLEVLAGLSTALTQTLFRDLLVRGGSDAALSEALERCAPSARKVGKP